MVGADPVQIGGGGLVKEDSGEQASAPQYSLMFASVVYQHATGTATARKVYAAFRDRRDPRVRDWDQCIQRTGVPVARRRAICW